MRREFPADFLWGTATSAYQIEGGAHLDGRGESIWDRLCRRPGAIQDASSGDVACDHYRRSQEDVALMARLGLGGYRFSTAWPRILPSGTGRVNEAGLGFYDRLVDQLLAAGVRPLLTLYHWDLPQRLQDRGGWPARDTAKAFVDYAGVVARRLGDRVDLWATHNEPWCISILGHQVGEHAPGWKDPKAAMAAAHHVLLSHGWAVQALKEELPTAAQVGPVLNLTPSYPASSSEADHDAARAFDGVFNRWFLDPLFLGHYPEDVIQDYRKSGTFEPGPLPFVEDGDMQAIGTPFDYLGVNYYSRAILRSTAIPESQNAPREVFEPADEERTDMMWEVFPEGMTELLLRLVRDYRPSTIYITENGCAYGTGPNEDGRIADARRIAFLEGHLEAVHRAMEAGVPVRGYFLWSLLDNFEWAHGYTKRFGITWVDYETQVRTLKDSAHRYAGIIAEGGFEVSA
jgi:beta-glucosidase